MQSESKEYLFHQHVSSSLNRRHVQADHIGLGVVVAVVVGIIITIIVIVPLVVVVVLLLLVAV